MWRIASKKMNGGRDICLEIDWVGSFDLLRQVNTWGHFRIVYRTTMVKWMRKTDWLVSTWYQLANQFCAFTSSWWSEAQLETAPGFLNRQKGTLACGSRLIGRLDSHAWAPPITGGMSRRAIGIRCQARHQTAILSVVCCRCHWSQEKLIFCAFIPLLFVVVHLIWYTDDHEFLLDHLFHYVATIWFLKIANITYMHYRL